MGRGWEGWWDKGIAISTVGIVVIPGRIYQTAIELNSNCDSKAYILYLGYLLVQCTMTAMAARA